jgi:hypothetical protein
VPCSAKAIYRLADVSASLTVFADSARLTYRSFRRNSTCLVSVNALSSTSSPS